MVHARPLVALPLFAALVACGSTEPLMDSVAGRYTATTFSVDQGGLTTDELAAGASITITLIADGTTAGRLFVPGGNEDGSDFDANLAGTWTLTGTAVTFAHAADTFLRNMTLDYSDGRLSGMETFSRATITLVLTRLNGP
jgi:hypothetical protein